MHFYEEVYILHFRLQEAPNSTRIMKVWRMVARRWNFDVDLKNYVAENILIMKMIFVMKSWFCKFLIKIFSGVDRYKVFLANGKAGWRRELLFDIFGKK